MKKTVIIVASLAILVLLFGSILIVNAVDQELSIVGCNLSFEDSIYIKYAVKSNNLSDVKLLIWTEPQTDYVYGTQKTILNSTGTETVAGSKCVIFCYNRLAAKQMGDVIYARAYVENDGDTLYSDVKKYSVLQYAYNKTGKTGTPTQNQNLIDLLETMLEYGAKAQINFNYKSDRLVNKEWYQVKVTNGFLDDFCNEGLYLPGDHIVVSALEFNDEGDTFSYWTTGDNVFLSSDRKIEISVIPHNTTYIAHYGAEPPVGPESYLVFDLSDDETHYIVSGINENNVTDIVIPAEYNGLPVEEVGPSAFSGCSNLTSIIIPNSVTTIGRRAFYNCSGLTEIYVPESITSIGLQAFYKCSNLETVYYDSSYCDPENPIFNLLNIKTMVFGGQSISEYIGKNLGIQSNVEQLQIAGEIQRVPDYAFYECANLKSVLFGNSVSEIGQYSFYGCTSINSVSIVNNTTAIKDSAFENCTSLSILNIPNNLTEIGYSAFYNCESLHELHFNGSLIQWLNINPNNWFDNPCKYGVDLYIDGALIVDVTIPNNFEILRDYAFYRCNSLVSITIPDTVMTLGMLSISGCPSLMEIDIPDSVIYIKEQAFANCSSLSTVIIPDSVYELGWGSFSGCTNLRSISIPNSITELPRSIFSYCESLTEVIIPDSVTSIGWGAFSECLSLTEVIIPDSVTSVGGSAFSGCLSLTEVIIPDSVTSIGERAFSGCSSMQTVTIPESVNSIGNNIFEECSSLNTVYYNSTYCNNQNKNKFLNLTSLKTIVFGSHSIPDSASEYMGFQDNVQTIIITDDVNSIGRYAFTRCNLLSNVTLPNSLSYMGINAFYDCASLKTIEIPGNLSSIPDSAFLNCANLKTIIINNGVENIGAYAFGMCLALENIALPESIKTIGNGAFYGCTKLEIVSLQEGLTSIGSSAFKNCNQLTAFNIPNTVINIGDSAFSNCKSLQSVVLPESITSILSNTFYSCKSLTSITIPRAVTSIGNYAFDSCSSLSDIYYNGTMNEWCDIIFAENSGYPIWNTSTGNYTIHCIDGDLPK